MGRYDDDEEEVTYARAKKAPARSRYDEDDDEEAPAPKSRRVEADDDDEDTPKPAARVIKRGWGAAQRLQESESTYAQRLKVTEDPIVVKFLEDEPYAVYRRHWMERSGQKSFTCIADIDDRGCPLCDAGSRPSSQFSFNVLLLSSDGEHAIKSYDVGVRVVDQLKNFSSDTRQGPLSKHYWAISKSGKGARTATNHQMVRDRDLPDDFGIEPLSDADLKRWSKQMYDASIIQIPTYKDLLEIAEEVDD